MRFYTRTIFFLSFITVYFAQAQPTTKVTYDSTTAIFCNPERGFSSQTEAAITATMCRNLRSQYISVIQKIYTMPQFRNDSLSQSFLNLVRTDLNTARQGGMKLVLRYSYSNDISGLDAPLDIILKHIEQLGVVWRENYDVIAYIEAGFIGAWGEWYYSSNNLDNTADRRTVLFKILSELPSDRMVVVRTPSYKRDIFNNQQPLTPDSAFSGSFRARTGAHNDCFLADAWDMGTYDDIETDKNYLNQDNRFVPQGGETCQPSEFSDCSHARVDLARMHWSLLNKDYNLSVLNSWIAGGCMSDIKRNLGYRFRLIQAVLADSVKPSGVFSIGLKILNVGYTSPCNPRSLELILRNTQSREVYFVITSEDPRFWMSGDTNLVQIPAGIPADIPEGDYEVLLHLADPVAVLHNRPEYSIRLANTGVWEDSTGYNSLLHPVVISNQASGEAYAGDLYFQPQKNHPSGWIENSETMPREFELIGNYPNPFNSATRIEFILKRTAGVNLDIIALDGKLITSLLNGNLDPGRHQILWQPQELGSGLYFYRLNVNGHIRIGKAFYVK
jgi:hypothetical protein